MDSYFEKYDLTEENAALITATVLDPKYKKTHEKLENSKGYLKCVADTIDAKKFKFAEGSTSQKNVPNNEQMSLSDSDDDAVDFKTTLQELKKYVSFKKENYSDFYEGKGQIFKRLKKAASYFLLSPATSVPVERIFSHASFQVKTKILSFPNNYL
jgi:hypothetical protein